MLFKGALGFNVLIELDFDSTLTSNLPKQTETTDGAWGTFY